MRSLYNCANAHVYDDVIHCKAHKILVNITKLAEGEPLELEVCQDCKVYEETFDPPLLPGEDRGWLKHLKPVPDDLYAKSEDIKA